MVGLWNSCSISKEVQLHYLWLIDLVGLLGFSLERQELNLCGLINQCSLNSCWSLPLKPVLAIFCLPSTRRSVSHYLPYLRLITVHSMKAEPAIAIDLDAFRLLYVHSD